MKHRLSIFFQCFLFFCAASLAVAQQNTVGLDNSAVRQTDSSVMTLQIQDSLVGQYIFPSDSRPYHGLDSIRPYIFVKGNDFVTWMHAMDSLQSIKRHLGYIDAPIVTKVIRPTWVIVVLILLLLGIGLVRLFFASLFRNIVQAYYDNQSMQKMSKEDSLLTSWPYIFLYVLFSFSLALFLLLCITSFEDEHMLTLANFFKLSGIVAILFAAKLLVLRILGIIFEIEKIIREYVVVLYLLYFNSMLIVMPLLLTITFVPVVYFNFILILFLIVVSGLFLYRFSIMSFQLIGQLKFSIFYLILYLCSLEIAPILILVKMLDH